MKPGWAASRSSRARLIDRRHRTRIVPQYAACHQRVPGAAAAYSCIGQPRPGALFAAQLQPERAFGQGWTDVDPRVPWLRTLLGELAPDKVLVICAHAATAIALRDHLLDRHAVHAALFHEHMEIVARDRAAAFFADSEEGARVLICSEIGRRTQFPVCPSPGAVRSAARTRPAGTAYRPPRPNWATHHRAASPSGGTAAEVLLRWYRDGLASFETVCPAASVVFRSPGGQLDNAMADPGQVDRLVAEAAALTATINTDLGPAGTGC